MIDKADTPQFECTECKELLTRNETYKQKDRDGVYYLCISCLGICRRIKQ